MLLQVFGMSQRATCGWKLCGDMEAHIFKCTLGKLPGTHTPCRAQQSPQTQSAPPPQVGRVCHTAPGQSGRSWTCGDLRAAASQNELLKEQLHWRQNRRRLSAYIHNMDHLKLYFHKACSIILLLITWFISTKYHLYNYLLLGTISQRNIN